MITATDSVLGVFSYRGPVNIWVAFRSECFVESDDSSGSLFEHLFEVVDGGGQHEFAELAVPRARVDSGAEPTLDGRDGLVGHPALAV